MVGTVFFYTSCEDFLDQSTLSEADATYVYSNPQNARAALSGAYEVWRDSRIHSNGWFYELTVCSSDAERHPEKYADQQRHIPENLYYGGTSGFSIDFGVNGYTRAYDIIARCNGLIGAIEQTKYYKEWVDAGYNLEPTELSQIYGEAVALRATLYLELCRYIGDIPYYTEKFEDPAISPRDKIYETEIAKLETVIPMLSRPGENEISATQMNRSYVEGLIGRLCLYAGGYATRRTDLGANFYTDMDGNTLSFDQIGTEYSGGVYTRRTDYRKFYEKAKLYLDSCVINSGSARLITTDPRANEGSRTYGNPFQYVFQQMLDLQVSSESIYEIVETQGIYSERPYAFGRPSGGGGSNAFPCKSYGQSRMHPTYYYGDFDPEDLRRDVTVAVTASVGNGRETLLSLEPGNKTNGGLANNKWDENRMSPPYYQAQRRSGVNNPYMRKADVILMLAEVYAELGDEGRAKTELTKVRSRAFPANMQAQKVTNYISGLSGEALKDAILTERKLEFGGEGIRKYDMIRNGKFPKMIETLKTNLTNMINGLETDGYYTFPNGNEIPAYVWTKQVDAGTDYGYRLTTQCTDKDDPVLFPGWRGQYDDWENVAGPGVGARYNGDYTTNTAIKGLFKHIVPESAEAANLEAQGYEMKKWGQWYVEYREEYSDYVYRGYVEGAAPIYLVPIIAQSISTSEGSIINGYGFDQE